MNLARQAARAFTRAHFPAKEVRRAYQLKWILACQFLGPRRLLLNPVRRKGANNDE